MTTALDRVTRVMEEITGPKARDTVNPWEWGFLATLQRRAPETLTSKAEEELSMLERRLFGDAAA